MPDRYPITEEGDVNDDNRLNSADAIYLLRHIIMPDKYPIYQKNESNSPQFVISSQTAYRGSAVEITVKVKNNPGIASIILPVEFDSNVFTLTNVIYNIEIGGQNVPPQNMNSPVVLYWINGFADAEGDFLLATLQFNVKSDAPLGDYDITLSYNPNDIYDISETNIPFEIVNGKITIK